jgi:protein KTI12
LYELDKATSDIVAEITAWQKDHPGESGGEVTVKDVDDVLQLPTSTLSLPQLQRLRRQFITLNRQHSLEKSRIRKLFVDYLNDSFGG